MSFNFLGLPKVSIAWIMKEMFFLFFSCPFGFTTFMVANKGLEIA